MFFFYIVIALFAIYSFSCKEQEAGMQLNGTDVYPLFISIGWEFDLNSKFANHK